MAGKQYQVIPVGRKAEGYFRFRGYQLGERFAGFSDNPTIADAKRIGEHVVELFTSGAVDQVELVYTRFVSRRQPGGRAPPARAADGRDGRRRRRPVRPRPSGPSGDYEFEPDPTTILERLLPSYVEARVYAALLNAAASEHAFRQRAMKAATDNAEELIKNLSRVMNRARQDSITTEIMEIVGGAEALGADGETRRHPHPRRARPDPPTPSDRRRVSMSMTITENRTDRSRRRPRRRHRRPGHRRRVPRGALPELNTALEFDITVDGEDGADPGRGRPAAR